jgi:hypothetical protein
VLVVVVVLVTVLVALEVLVVVVRVPLVERPLLLQVQRTLVVVAAA